MTKKNFEIAVYHVVFDEMTGNPLGHRKVAGVFVDDVNSVDDALEVAFARTNNIRGGSWSRGEFIEGNVNPDWHIDTITHASPDGRPHRSSMMGDLFYVCQEDKTYICNAVGFSEKFTGRLAKYV